MQGGFYMNEKHLLPRNEIVLNGRIVSQRLAKNGSMYITVISNSGKDVFPVFRCPKGILPELKHHAHVSIKGYIDTYAEMRGDTRTFRQLFVAEEVKPQPTLTEEAFGVKGAFFKEFDCKIYLSGEIISTLEDNEWIRIILRTNANDRPVSVQINMRKLDRQPKIERGDKVYVVCGLSTPKKVLNGETVYFENLIVSDISINPN